MEDFSLVSTLMVNGCKLGKDDEFPRGDQTMYMSIMGNLLYLATTKPDIMQVISVVSRYQLAPKQSHLLTTKRIL